MTELHTEKFWRDLKSGRFASMVKEASKGQPVNNSHEVYNIMKPVFAKEDDVEMIYCIFLNAQNEIIKIEKMFSGSITASVVYPREIIKRLISLKASAFVMVHNHPSGDIKPSVEDKTMTIKVGLAAASIDVSFHDHIIIGDSYYSMSDTGWLQEIKKRLENLISPNNLS